MSSEIELKLSISEFDIKGKDRKLLALYYDGKFIPGQEKVEIQSTKEGVDVYVTFILAPEENCVNVKSENGGLWLCWNNEILPDQLDLEPAGPEALEYLRVKVQFAVNDICGVETI